MLERLGSKKSGTMSAGNLVVSPSWIDYFCACKRKAYWKYNRRLVPRKIAWNLVIGTWAHLALEVYYRDWDIDSALQAVRAAIKEFRCQHPHLDVYDENQFHLASAIVLGFLTAYAQYYCWEQEKWWVVATEVKFDGMRLMPRVQAKGRVDLLVEGPRGLVAVEHKTRSMITGGYLQALPMAYQSALYPIAAERKFDLPVHKIIYNFIRKPNIRQRKNEEPADFIRRVRQDYSDRPQEYFYREVVRMTGRRRRQTLDGLTQVCKEARSKLRATEDPLVAYYREPTACTMYGICEYMPLCLRGERSSVMAMYMTDKGETEE